MKLIFNLDYQTIFGEEIVLHIDDCKLDFLDASHKMTTIDGHRWTCEVSYPGVSGRHIDYYYSVNRGDDEMRREWLTVPHRLIFSCAKAKRYTIYDHWLDLPEDSYLYSSAFTDCLAVRPMSKLVSTGYGKTALINVRAPQLAGNQRLVLCGEGAVLGDWNAKRGIEMTEITHNQWAVKLNASKLGGRITFKFVAVDDKGNICWEECDNRNIDFPTLATGEVVCYELSQATFPLPAWRVAGTVIPIFSLRSKQSAGVGDFGDLKKMIDWMELTGQRALQVLPINDTTITKSWTDSYPYNSISIYALHPMYVDLKQLPALKDVEKMRHYQQLGQELNKLPQVDYERVNELKLGYLRDVWEQEGAKIIATADYKKFYTASKRWLVPYAAFCVLRDKYGTARFSEWPNHRQFTPSLKKSVEDTSTAMGEKAAFWMFVQYELSSQMKAAHDYARSKHVILKGDIPIGISPNGCDAWVEPNYFNMNGQAGAPPDAFSADGQNWGFPTYNWDEMLKDGCKWWVQRFQNMSEYFDAYRIDHVLGFFRIWEIPIHSVQGLLGQFSPALGMTREEVEGYGLRWQEDFFLNPYIADWVIDRVFGPHAQRVRDTFLLHSHDDIWKLRPEFDTQRKVEAAFAGKTSEDDKWVRDGLYSLINNVLFVRDRKDANKFHPRITAQLSLIYEALWDNDKEAFNRIYNDYYYRRNNRFWYHEAMKKLPRLVEATRMLVCAEDLGMVPDCVPWVMNELKILSLEIQSMPKDNKLKFGNLQSNPYRSVCTISTHDMSTLRQWWDEDWQLSQEYYNEVMWKSGPAPHPLPGWLARDIVAQHLYSPSMLCLLSLQDWLSIDEQLRLPNADAERINVPANPRHYWRYRMHMTIEDLMSNSEFNAKVKQLIAQSNR